MGWPALSLFVIAVVAMITVLSVALLPGPPVLLVAGAVAVVVVAAPVVLVLVVLALVALSLPLSATFASSTTVAFVAPFGVRAVGLPILPFAMSATTASATIQPGLLGLARRFGRALGLNVSVHGVLEGLAVNDDLVCDLLEGSGFPKRKRDAPGCVLPVELQLLDLVGLAAYQALPVFKVAIQVVLGRIFDEYQRHVVGRQAVQESCLRLRAPAILGLRLQLQVRVHDQGRRFLRARALLGGEVVGDALKRRCCTISSSGTEQCCPFLASAMSLASVASEPRSSVSGNLLVFLNLLLPVSGRQLLRLGRGGRRGRFGRSRRRGRSGRVCFPTLSPNVPEASACHRKLCCG